jgi:serine/threonine protein kinase
LILGCGGGGGSTLKTGDLDIHKNRRSLPAADGIQNVPQVLPRIGATTGSQPSFSHVTTLTSGASLAKGRYELREFISKGGMGAVYRAWDVELGRWVAVKCLLDVGRKGSRELALKEAKALASVSHPNIMRIYDILNVDDRRSGSASASALEGDDAGQIWIVTEWLEGRCLTQLPTPLPPTCVLAIMAQIYDALAAAHAAQIIHRDIKPSNVMISDSGRISIIDFGVAFAPGLSTGETVVGSLRYADPRILEGRQPDVNSDLFSAALMQIELMTGETVLPDLAPLPLYRHVRRNLQGRIDLLLDGTYPPLAAIARRHTGEMLEALNNPSKQSNLSSSFSASHSAAREAALIAQDQLRKLTNKTADQYLSSKFYQSDLKDFEASKIMATETAAAISSSLLTPRQKAAWVAFQTHEQQFYIKAQILDASQSVTSMEKGHKEEKEEEEVSEFKIASKKRTFSHPLPMIITIFSSTLIILSLLLWMKLTAQERLDVSTNPFTSAATENNQIGPTEQLVATDVAAAALPPEILQKEASTIPIVNVSAAQSIPVYIAANAWANVTIDGREIGRLPQAAPFHLEPGSHKLRLENPIVEPLEVVIDVKASAANRLKFTLNPKTTPRVIKLSKPGRLYVDGVDHGVVTTKALPLTYGTHEIWIKRDDKIIKLENIPVGPDSPLEISVNDE